MINFTISAPGQISLFGEHAVKQSKSAILSSLNMRTTLEFTELEHSERDIIKIKFPQIGLYCNILLRTFMDFYYTNFDEDELLYYKVVRFIADQELNLTRNRNKCLKAFFYLLIYIGHREKLNIRPFQVNFSANFIGTGLGNTRSYTACVAMCFFHWSRVQNGVHYTQYDNDDLWEIFLYNMNYNSIFSRPRSIFDLIPCIFGGIYKIQLQRTCGESKWHFNELSNFPHVTILLVDTLQEPDMTFQRTQIKNLKHSYPAINASVMNIIDAISNKAVDIFSEITMVNIDNAHDTEETNEDILRKYKKLESLIHMNQELLDILGVSNENLNKICSIAQKYGLFGKYTDAGRYAFIWLHIYIQNEPLASFTRELIDEGFAVSSSELNCDGVKIE